LVFPKGQKKWVAKPIKISKSFSFVEDLMEAVFSIKDDKTDDKDTTDDEDNTACIPKNIAPTPRFCISLQQLASQKILHPHHDFVCQVDIEWQCARASPNYFFTCLKSF
jgi:hypothetical protein